MRRWLLVLLLPLNSNRKSSVLSLPFFVKCFVECSGFGEVNVLYSAQASE
ncbi:hypothetical protein RchiOBHm_Chr7g0234281 [Rosa chinensis]|uniref:Uncharacterized protein n=1 Tax=Rosa chinensis TaxID=74649 RepID=A0A2P6PGD9_ROSCH|nr:hypothetical protein RchiOBHm_Chr7g0234281 [Rosa chinensis]